MQQKKRPFLCAVLCAHISKWAFNQKFDWFPFFLHCINGTLILYTIYCLYLNCKLNCSFPSFFLVPVFDVADFVSLVVVIVISKKFVCVSDSYPAPFATPESRNKANKGRNKKRNKNRVGELRARRKDKASPRPSFAERQSAIAVAQKAQEGIDPESGDPKMYPAAQQRRFRALNRVIAGIFPKSN